jgi:hypothetical protein
MTVSKWILQKDSRLLDFKIYFTLTLHSINELAMNSKNKNIRDLYRGINEFKTGCQPRSIFVKDENGYLFADSNITLNRWKSYFSQY